MVSSSSSDSYHIVDDDEYDFEELELEESLMSSESQISTASISSSSSSSQRDASSPSSQKDASSSSQTNESLSSQNDASSSFQTDVSSSSSQTNASTTDVSSPLFETDASSSSSSSSQTDPPSPSIPATSKPSHVLKRKQPIVTSKHTKVLKSFCGICMDTKAPSEMFSNATVCGHLFCSDCIRGHVSSKIKENIVSVKCPEPKCNGVIGPELCRSFLPKEVIERWEDALCESLILGTQKFYCPFKDCSSMLVDDGGEAVTSSECPNCNRLFCAQCKVSWHTGMRCSEFKRLKKNERNPEDIMLMQLAKNNKWRRCPSCNFYVEKREGCHHITCRCGYEFCYRCGKKYDKSHACNP